MVMIIDIIITCTLIDTNLMMGIIWFLCLYYTACGGSVVCVLQFAFCFVRRMSRNADNEIESDSWPTAHSFAVMTEMTLERCYISVILQIYLAGIGVVIVSIFHQFLLSQTSINPLIE